jgi:hypothetical protein
MTLAAIGFGGIAAICFGLAILLMYKKFWPKSQPWLMLIAGLGIAGGMFGVLVDKLAGVLTNASATTARMLFAAGGAAGAAGLAIWLGVYLYIHLKPKGQKPTKLTRWIALIYPSVLVTVGGVFLGISMTAGEAFAVVAREVGALIDQVVSGAGR